MRTHRPTRRSMQHPGRTPAHASLEVLERLPDDEREILVLSSFYGLAQDEIASLIGASVGWVEALAARAREHLRLLLTAQSWPESQAA